MDVRPEKINLHITKDTIKSKLFCIIQKGNGISSVVKRVNLVSIAVGQYAGHLLRILNLGISGPYTGMWGPDKVLKMSRMIKRLFLIISFFGLLWPVSVVNYYRSTAVLKAQCSPMS